MRHCALVTYILFLDPLWHKNLPPTIIVPLNEVYASNSLQMWTTNTGTRMRAHTRAHACMHTYWPAPGGLLTLDGLRLNQTSLGYGSTRPMRIKRHSPDIPKLGGGLSLTLRFVTSSCKRENKKIYEIKNLQPWKFGPMLFSGVVDNLSVLRVKLHTNFDIKPSAEQNTVQKFTIL